MALGGSAFLVLAGCAVPRPAPQAEPATEHHVGDGWAVRIPAGARVRQEDGRLAVDAPDGRRWFDVSWHDGDREPAVIAHAWAAGTCSPALWDQPSEPVPGTWISGAACTIDGKRFFALVAVDTFGEQRMLTAYVAQDGYVSYENAWLDFVTTALSLKGGSEPLPVPDLAALRSDIREAAVQPAGSLPVPGGGLLSGRIVRALPDFWPARHLAPPRPFAPERDGIGP